MHGMGKDTLRKVSGCRQALQVVCDMQLAQRQAAGICCGSSPLLWLWPSGVCGFAYHSIDLGLAWVTECMLFSVLHMYWVAHVCAPMGQAVASNGPAMASCAALS
jgi:hypothetical protein